MPTDQASYRAKYPEDTKRFTDSPPNVLPDGATHDMDMSKVAPDHLHPREGHDTYAGIPGDGIVPG